MGTIGAMIENPATKVTLVILDLMVEYFLDGATNSINIRSI